MKKHLIDTLQTVWSLHDELKHGASSGCLRIAERLSRLSVSGPAMSLADKVRTAGLRLKWKKRGDVFVLFVRGLLLLPAVVQQVRHLRKALKIGPGIVLACASNRLEPPADSADNIRNYLSSLVQPLPPHQGDWIVQKEIKSAGHIILIDPVRISQYWSLRRKCWNEGIFIVDWLFVLVASGPMACFQLLLDRKGGRDNDYCSCLGTGRFKSTIIKAFFCAAVITTCDGLFSNASAFSAIFLTCHSMLVEHVRGYLMQSECCSTIYEIMHGCGSLLTERYFDGIKKFDEKGKLVVVPLMPILPLPGALGDFRYHDSIAVDAYWNKFLLDLKFLDKPTLKIRLCEELERMVDGCPMKEGVKIISFFGGYVDSGNGVDHRWFCGELKLLRLVVDILSSKPSIVVYFPHPYVRAAGGHALVEAVGALGTVIGEHSVWGLLFSDMIISVLSSILFEAAYLGIPTFTPLLPEEGIFSKEYLDLVDRPSMASQQDIEAALRCFEVQHDAGNAGNRINRASSRLKKMGLTRSALAANDHGRVL